MGGAGRGKTAMKMAVLTKISYKLTEKVFRIKSKTMHK